MSIGYGRGAPVILIAVITISAAAGLVLFAAPNSFAAGEFRFDARSALGILLWVGCGYLALVLVRSRGSRWALVLRPDDLTVSFGRHEVTATWDSVMMIYPAGIQYAPATMGIGIAFWEGLSTLALRRRTWMGRSVPWGGERASTGQLLPTLVRPVWLGLDPVLTLHTLTFYFEHTHLRHELSTPAALGRIRSWDVIAP